MRLSTKDWPGLAPEPASLVKIAQSTLAPESHLHITLQPPLDRSEQSRSTFEVNLENDGDEAGIYDLSIHAAPAGCLQTEPVAYNAIKLLAHQADHRVFTVDSSQCTHQVPFSAAVQWTYTWTLAGKPIRSFAGFLSTSPITFITPYAEAWQRALLLLSSLARNFTWPILLAVLGYLGQASLARRGEQQQILNTLLPTLTELMQTHYLAIVRRIQRIQLEIDAFAPLHPANDYDGSFPLKRAFSAILLMRRQLIHLANSKGGVFFRSSVAEDIFSLGIGRFYKRFMQAAGDGDLCESVAISLAIDSLPHQAHQKIFSPLWGQGRISDLYTSFAAWAVDQDGALSEEFSQYLILLDLCQGVLSFEFDRVFYQTNLDTKPVFKSWYLDPPAFEFSGDINNLPSDLRDEIWPKYVKYLNGMPKKCRKGIKYPRVL